MDLTADTIAAHRTPDWLVLALACVAQFMVLLDVSIVNVAWPSIRHSLGFSQVELQSVLERVRLTFAGFLLLRGRAADLFGRRRIFLVDLTVWHGLRQPVRGSRKDQAMLIGGHRQFKALEGDPLSCNATILTTTFSEPRARAEQWACGARWREQRRGGRPPRRHSHRGVVVALDPVHGTVPIGEPRRSSSGGRSYKRAEPKVSDSRSMCSGPCS